jgi:hypothetical protein
MHIYSSPEGCGAVYKQNQYDCYLFHCIKISRLLRKRKLTNKTFIDFNVTRFQTFLNGVIIPKMQSAYICFHLMTITLYIFIRTFKPD